MGENSLKETFKILLSVAKIMQKAGMMLTKWITNDGELIKCCPEEDLNT